MNGIARTTKIMDSLVVNNDLNKEAEKITGHKIISEPVNTAASRSKAQIVITHRTEIEIFAANK